MLMQMIQLMPTDFSTISDQRLTAEICEIIANIATNAKDPKTMQKIAGDIEAIEKISDILIQRSLANYEPSITNMGL
jgi:hypothetical protein